MTPKRIQRKRTKGWRMPEGAVYVGRPTLFGNPFPTVGIYTDWLRGVFIWGRDGYTARELIDKRQWVRANIDTLRGKDLACWCKEGQPCHADVLLKLANGRDSAAD